MLVSSIARMNAIQQRNQAEFNIMNNHIAMGAMMRNMSSPAFLSPQSLKTLSDIDTKMQLDLENNKLNYLFYSLWEKSLKQQQQKEIKERFSNLNIMA